MKLIQTLALLLTFIYGVPSYSQNFSLNGMVLDSATQQPLRGASVYLTGTTIGTIADAAGYFHLTNISPGTYQLTVSLLGYHPAAKEISEKSTDSIFVTLTSNPTRLDEVVVAASGKKNSGWRRWGALFFNSLVGSSPFSTQCIIQNKEEISFSRKDNILTAKSSRPLIIKNPALGYTIRYHLNDFSYNLITGRIAGSGAALYEHMQGDSLQEIVWRDNRQEAYGISLMRFFRSLYNDELKKDGYEMFTHDHTLKIILSNDFKIGQRMPPGTHYATFTPFDTVLLTAQDICIRTDSETLMLTFKKLLLINQFNMANTHGRLLSAWLQDNRTGYNNQPPASLIQHKTPVYAGKFSSALYIHPPGNIYIKRNGYYSEGTRLILYHLFGWTETLGTMLPLDYYP